METRDFKLWDGKNGTLQMQLQWAQGGGRKLVGAVLNFYERDGSPRGHAPMTVDEVKALHHHLTAILTEYNEI